MESNRRFYCIICQRQRFSSSNSLARHVVRCRLNVRQDQSLAHLGAVFERGRRQREQNEEEEVEVEEEDAELIESFSFPSAAIGGSEEDISAEVGSDGAAAEVGSDGDDPDEEEERSVASRQSNDSIFNLLIIDYLFFL